MSHYKVPLADMSFQLFDVWQVQQFWQQQTELSSRLVPDTVDLNLVYFEAVEWGQRLLAVQHH